MSSNAVPVRPPITRDAAGTLFGQTMGLVAVTAGLFAVGAYLGRDLSFGWGWLGFLAAFGCLIAMNFAAQRSQELTVTLLFGFGLLIGVATAPTLRYCAGADPQAVWQAGVTIFLRADPGRRGDLRNRWSGDLRRVDGLRLPAPSPQPGPPDRAAAGSLDLSRPPQRVPAVPVAVRQRGPAAFLQ
jgi:hypothetical protein